MNKEFFISLCRVNGLDPNKASRIIDGRYKPYLSSLDDLYYSGNDVWDAKINALNTAIKRQGIETVKSKLIKL